MPAATPAPQSTGQGLTAKGNCSWCPFEARKRQGTGLSSRGTKMRMIFLYATVAFLCCGNCSLFAQIRTLNGAPSPAPRLAANQAEVDGAGIPLVPSEQPAIANPFDMLQGNAGDNAPATPSFTQPTQPSQPAGDPTSLPVKQENADGNLVNTMANHALVDSIPNASVTPVDWCLGQMRAPNHVAQVLMHQECVDGLWARYPAQRAHECAHMWNKLTVKKGCHGDNCCYDNCCNSGCNNGCCPGNGHGGRCGGLCGGKCGGGCGNGCCSSGDCCQSGCDSSCAHCAANANANVMRQAERLASTQSVPVR